ncbi:MAG TPA: hypothetical protein VKB79_27115 [Bryobacteraceae bacterium]|nr:hypothetical protein [Bryobacteraceae bacterium]
MSAFPGSPRLLKCGIATWSGGLVGQIIVLQYNPDTLTRTLQIQSAGNEPGDRLEALRLKGPPLETIKLEAEVDVTDQLEQPDDNPVVVQNGLQPQLSALELLLYPTVNQLTDANSLASQGVLELVSIEAPLTLFVWSAQRIVPVRITEFSITEEAFDPALNPIRAKISLGMRVLSVMDLGFTRESGGGMYLAYQSAKEGLARQFQYGTPAALGVSF